MSVLTDEVKAMLNEAYTLTEEKKGIEDRLKEINKRLIQISAAAQEHFEGEEISIKGVKVYLQIEPCFNVLAKDKQALITAMKNDPNAAGIVKEDYHPSTFKAYMKERLLNDGELPYKGLVSQYNKPTLKFRRLG